MVAAMRLANALMHYRDQIPPDVEKRAQIFLHGPFAALARHVGQVLQSTALQTMDWDAMIDEISKMILGYVLAK